MSRNYLILIGLLGCQIYLISAAPSSKNNTNFEAEIKKTFTEVVSKYEELRKNPDIKTADTFLNNLNQSRNALLKLWAQEYLSHRILIQDADFKERVHLLQVQVHVQAFNNTLNWMEKRVKDFKNKHAKFYTVQYNMIDYKQGYDDLTKQFPNFLDDSKFNAYLDTLDAKCKNALNKKEQRKEFGKEMRQIYLDTMTLGSKLMVLDGTQQTLAEAKQQDYPIVVRANNEYQEQFYLHLAVEAMSYYTMVGKSAALSVSQASLLSTLVMLVLAMFNNFRY